MGPLIKLRLMVPGAGVEPARGVSPTRFCPVIRQGTMSHDMVSLAWPCTNGAEGETRTLTMLPSPDFESGASTDSATPA